MGAQVVVCLVVLALGLTLPTSAQEVAPADEPPPFPNLVLTSLEDDRQVDIASFRGRPVLVTFWASWCGPCRVELTHLQQLHRELGDDRFALLAVNVDATTVAARRFLDVTKLEIPVYRVSQTDLVKLGVRSIPTNILLDPEGRAVRLYEGYSPAVPDVIRELVRGMAEDSGA
jgi:thiol-disulfide isomerase/thioredoxin